MSDAANSMRYCHGDQPSECIDGCGDHAGNVAGAATIPDPASADDHTHGSEVACLEELPRKRGAVDASRGGAMKKMRGAVLAATIPYHGKAQSPESSDDHTHGAEDACLVVPPDQMRGAVGAGAPSPAGGGSAMPKTRGAAAPSRGGGTMPPPRMRGAVADADASRSIDDMAARLGLVEAAVGDKAKEVFRRLEHARALHRPAIKNRHALYAACLHVACRAVGTPCTFKELASAVPGDVAVRDIVKLVKHVKAHVGEESGGGVQAAAAGEMVVGAVVLVRAGDLVRRFSSLVGIGDQEVDAALEAARRLERNLDVRRSPDSIAAALIYMAVQRAGAGKSFRDVSAAIGVSELTIKEVYYRDLCAHSELLFD